MRINCNVTRNNKIRQHILPKNHNKFFVSTSTPVTFQKGVEFSRRSLEKGMSNTNTLSIRWQFRFLSQICRFFQSPHFYKRNQSRKLSNQRCGTFISIVRKVNLYCAQTKTFGFSRTNRSIPNIKVCNRAYLAVQKRLHCMLLGVQSFRVFQLNHFWLNGCYDIEFYEMFYHNSFFDLPHRRCPYDTRIFI